MAGTSILKRWALALTLAFVTLGAGADSVQVKTLAGADTTLAEHIHGGQWTLVMMWTTYCGVCRRQYPEISTFHDRHRDRDATVLGVSLDGYDALEDVRAYVARKPFTFPTVVGEPDVLGAVFERATDDPFTGTPTYLLFNPQRVLVAAVAGEVSLEALENYIAQSAP